MDKKIFDIGKVEIPDEWKYHAPEIDQLKAEDKKMIASMFPEQDPQL